MGAVFVSDHGGQCDLADLAGTPLVVSFGQLGAQALEDALGDTRHMSYPGRCRDEQNIGRHDLFEDCRSFVARAHVRLHTRP